MSKLVNPRNRIRRLGLVVAVGAILGSYGCGAGRGGSADADLSNLRPVPEFMDRLQSGQVIREDRFIDLGTPSARNRLGSGWGSDELRSNEGSTYVWATDRVAEVKSFLFDTRARRLYFQCRAFVWEGAPDQVVTASINDRIIGSVTLGRGDKTYSLRIPKGTLVFGTNRIKLEFAYAVKVEDHRPGSTDTRTLAAAFDFIGVAPPPPPKDGVERLEESPEFHGESVVLRPGVGVSYRFAQPGEVALDFGLAVDESTAASSLRVVGWARREGRPRVEKQWVNASAIGDQRWRVHIGPGEGRVEVGFAAVGSTGASDAEMPTVSVEQPRLFSGGAEANELSNVLLIVVDTLRADRVGAYGASVATPNIDALAARGVRFERAYSHIPITGPSHSSLLTSLLPSEHGVRNNAQILPDAYQTLPEALRAEGRITAGVVSLGVLHREFGFSRGFDFYLDRFGHDWLKNAEEVNSEVIDLLDGLSRDPYFLWVHYSDPHEPYTPPDLSYPRIALELNGKEVGEQIADGRDRGFVVEVAPGTNTLTMIDRGPNSSKLYRLTGVRVNDRSVGIDMGDSWNVRQLGRGATQIRGKLPSSIEFVNPGDEPRRVRFNMGCRQALGKAAVRERYALEVEYVDRQIGRLLAVMEERGLLEDTLVIFLSDHGEGLGDHKHLGHISQLYDTLLRVPLIMVDPGRLPQGLVIEEPVSLIDVLPTVGELLDLPMPPKMSGRSLVPLLNGGVLPEAPIVAVTYRPEAYSEKRALIAGGFKYIHSWHDDDEWEELYDLESDPDELVDLAADQPERVEAMRTLLYQRLRTGQEAEAVEAELSDEEIERLRALGYVH